MKKKIVILSSLFLLIVSLLFVGFTTVENPNSGNSNPIKLSTSTKKDALSISGDILMDVGEEIDFSDKYKLYVTAADKDALTYEVEDEEIIYLTKNKSKFIALKAGQTKLTISSDKYFTELNITVKIKNFCEEGTFETLTVGSRWTQSNQDISGWRLYTGGAAVAKEQIVEIINYEETYPEEQNEETYGNVVHYYHTSSTQYSNLYKSFDVEPGQYYVTAKMKGIDVLKDAYVRVNQGNKYGLTQTQKIKSTFDWTEFQSEVVRVAPGEKLKLEMYFANNSGELWFDDLRIYRVITTDYTSFTVNNAVEKLEVGGTAQISCETFPESIIDYQYYYESEDSSIATVDKLGNIKAVKNGITNIKVTDSLYGYERTVKVIVGIENGISAVVKGDLIVEVNEDTTNVIEVEVSGSTDYVVSKYTEAVYGNYYVIDNEIYYTPKADYWTVENVYDTFKVIVFDSTKGYCVVTVTIKINPIDDEAVVIEYWHTTDKNTNLEWVEETNKGKHSSGNLYNGGYLQIECEDIEALYPQFYKKNMTTEELAAKTTLYTKVYGTAVDGTFEITTEKGGKVVILLDGKAQEIHDRYYDSQGKIVYGILYNYLPPKDYYGYDHFDIVVKNGNASLTVTNTVYVAPDMADFKFDQLDFSGVYLLSNSEWLSEISQGLAAGDEYITEWVNYYEAQYAIHVPAGVPASARTPMEQLAILYQVTGKKKYFEMCWAEMLPVIRDEEYTDGENDLAAGTRRLTWGEDSNGFLDAAMVTYSVAFAYNYIKDQLNDAQKNMVMRALYEEGFYYFENLNNVNVLLHGNNHNLLVCGDLAIAALSAMSFDGEITVNTRDNGVYSINVREMAAEVVSTAFKYLQIGLVHYAENGGFPEGPSYSIYAHRNMVSLLGTLWNLYGTDENGKINSFGLSEIEGIMNYVNYPLYTSSPNYESFYYAESDYSNNQPALLWYTRFDENNYNAALLSKLAHEKEQYNIQALLYYKPGLFERVDASKIQELDYLLDEHELATFRSAFGDEMAIFTGLKGTNSDSGAFAHKNLDSGTFELYALGEKFIGNFANETYNVVVPDGYWDYDYQRWTYYKKNAQGQNTLVFNPEKNPVLTQDPYEKAKIFDFASNELSAMAKIDLSRVYKSDAVSVIRGLKLFDNRSTVMVQDEFVMRDYSTVYWSAHTEAKIDIINDKLARLTVNGKSVYAMITSELGAFTVMSANEPLPGTQGDFCNLDNKGVNKLVIKLENILSATLCVVFVPTLEEMTEFKSYPVVPLNDWALDNEETSYETITVENIELVADFGKQYKYVFNPYQYEYVVKLAETTKEIPNLNVSYDTTKYEVTVLKGKYISDLTKVIVKDKQTGNEVVYTYKFIVDAMIDGYSEYTRLEVLNVTGSNGAEKVIDGNNNSVFSSTKKEELVFELAELTELTNVLIRFTGGILNTYYFDIYYSEDGINYECCYFAGQSNNSMGDEVYTIGNIKAKYIKIIFTGNDANVDKEAIKVAEVAFLYNGYVPTKPKTNGCGGCGGSIASSILGVIALAATFIIKRKKEEE